jgi:hypothetical protein
MNFYCVNFVNVKIGCMFIEYNGVSLIGENCKNLLHEHYVDFSKL